MGNRNHEGYPDPTASNGIKNVVREELSQEAAVNKLLRHIRYVSGLDGFEVVERITFRHKQTGKMSK